MRAAACHVGAFFCHVGTLFIQRTDDIVFETVFLLDRTEKIDKYQTKIILGLL